MQNSIGFYSQAVKVLDEFPQSKAPPIQIVKYLNHNGVCLEELVWAGILDKNHNLSNQFNEFKLINKNVWVPLLNAQLMNICETQINNDVFFNRFLYGNYSNYRIIFLNYPFNGCHEYNNFYSLHFPQIKNTLVFIVLTDRILDGKKCLHVEGIQSEWSQFGKQHGFIKNQLMVEDTLNKINEINKEKNEKNIIEINNLTYKYISKIKTAVPDGPFVQDPTRWIDLAIGRILIEAVKNDYDAIIFTMGNKQRKRFASDKKLKFFYDLWISKRLNLILHKYDFSNKIENRIYCNENEENIAYIKLSDATKIKVLNGVPNYYTNLSYYYRSHKEKFTKFSNDV